MEIDEKDLEAIAIFSGISQDRCRVVIGCYEAAKTVSAHVQSLNILPERVQKRPETEQPVEYPGFDALTQQGKAAYHKGYERGLVDGKLERELVRHEEFQEALRAEFHRYRIKWNNNSYKINGKI